VQLFFVQLGVPTIIFQLDFACNTVSHKGKDVGIKMRIEGLLFSGPSESRDGKCKGQGGKYCLQKGDGTLGGERKCFLRAVFGKVLKCTRQMLQKRFVEVPPAGIGVKYVRCGERFVKKKKN